MTRPRLQRLLRDLPPIAFVGVAALIAGLALAFVPLPDALRVVIGLPLVLVAPGWALVSACFGARPLDPVMRGVLTLSTSIGVAILGGLALAAVNVRLDATAFALVSAAVTAVAAGAAVRQREPEAGPAQLSWALAPSTTVLLVGAFAVAVLAVVFARQPPATKAVTPYTALWAVRVSPHNVRVGVISGQLRPSTYRVDLVGTRNRTERVTITLRPGQHWQRVISTSGRIYPHYVELRRLPSLEVYRRVDVPRES